MKALDKHYRIVRFISRGQHGEVLLIERRKDAQLFAVKVVPCDDMAQANEYLLEALRMLNLQHPGIIRFQTAFLDEQVHYGVEVGKVLCIVMELADGGDLKSYIETRKAQGLSFSEREIFECCVTVLQALQYAYEEYEVIHRDIKPQNILICGGQFKVADFGEAKALETTCTQTVRGTPCYMAPEIRMEYERGESQARYGANCDVYSVGMIALDLATMSFAQQRKRDEHSVLLQIRELESKYSPQFLRWLEGLVCHNVQSRFTISSAVIAAVEASEGLAPSSPKASAMLSPTNSTSSRADSTTTTRRREVQDIDADAETVLFGSTKSASDENSVGAVARSYVPSLSAESDGPSLLKSSIVEGAEGKLAWLSQVDNVELPVEFCMGNVKRTVQKLATSIVTDQEQTLSVQLPRKRLCSDDATVLAKALCRNLHIRSIDLDGNNIRCEGARVISESLAAHPAVTELNLARNHIWNVGARHLGQMLRSNRSLEKLNLFRNDITDRGAAFLAEGLKLNDTLNSLDLMGNSINKEGGMLIVEALKMSRSPKFDLKISIGVGYRDVDKAFQQLVLEKPTYSVRTHWKF
eukprot:GILJ01004209.1.p1 GENE.GILJ01004209.1~~GILJ01004209.1.p1  ORF type:complete len:582 (+),score=60.74 GILJ01004209.1:1184-2929(+)